jgi:hypothetical protein
MTVRIFEFEPSKMMKNLITKLLAAALLTAVVALGAGCATTVKGTSPGAGAVVWDIDTLKSQEYASYEQGWNAGMLAMNQLGHPVVRQEKSELRGTITARLTGDEKITIKVSKVSGNVVGYEIRVGTWGDKAQSLQILEIIRARL